MCDTRSKEPCTFIQIGFIFLILANCAHYFLHPGAVLSERYTDFINGILYGLSIGFLGWGVVLNSRRRRGGGSHA